MKNEKIKPISKKTIDDVAIGLTKMFARLLNLFGLIKKSHILIILYSQFQTRTTCPGVYCK